MPLFFYFLGNFIINAGITQILFIVKLLNITVFNFYHVSKAPASADDGRLEVSVSLNIASR